MQPLNTELILIRITGEDRPGLTASVTEILAKYDATILDIGQADIHNTLSLGILCKTEEQHSGFNGCISHLFDRIIGYKSKENIPRFLYPPCRNVWKQD